MSLAAWMAADLLYFHSTHELRRSDLVVVSGTVERTAFVPVPPKRWSRNSSPEPHTDVWLVGREFPFRFFGAQWRDFSLLPAGAPFSVGLNPKDLQSPLKPTFLRPAPCYVPMTVIMQDGWWDARLTHHNSLARSNLAVMPWLCPLLALLGILLSTRMCVELMASQARSRYGPTRNPLKGRMSLRLLK